MFRSQTQRPFDVLLIEDNPGDVRLLQEAFRELEANIRLSVAKDGAEGLTAIFAREKSSANLSPPDLVLLDLNIPKVNGHEVLSQIKADPATCQIPVIILTSSRAEVDVRRAYQSHANAYLRKPSTFEELVEAAKHINNFWVNTATLPS